MPGGNAETRQASANGQQSKRWCFTLNNPGTEDPPDWGHWTHLRYAVCQLERGASGTPHLQGYCQFSSAKRLRALQALLPRAHWEVARGNLQQNIDYCTKQDGRVAGPWTFGEPTTQGQRTDLTAVKRALDEGRDMRYIADNYFGDWVRYRESFEAYKRLRGDGGRDGTWRTELIVIVGPPGTGKSRLARELAGNDGYYHSMGKWWDGYDGQRVVVMDDFAGNVPFRELLKLCDFYPHQVEVKGGSRNFISKLIIITSNDRPEQWYDNEKNTMLALYRRISQAIWLDATEETSKFYVFTGAPGDMYTPGSLY